MLKHANVQNLVVDENGKYIYSLAPELKILSGLSAGLNRTVYV